MSVETLIYSHRRICFFRSINNVELKKNNSTEGKQTRIRCNEKCHAWFVRNIFSSVDCSVFFGGVGFKWIIFIGRYASRCDCICCFAFALILVRFFVATLAWTNVAPQCIDMQKMHRMPNGYR